MDARDSCENTQDHCCLYSISPEETVTHDCFATVLTKAQVKTRPEAEKAMKDEIRKRLQLTRILLNLLWLLHLMRSLT